MFDLSFDCKDTKKISQYQILEQRIQRKIDFSQLSRDKIRRKSISPPNFLYFSHSAFPCFVTIIFSLALQLLQLLQLKTKHPKCEK